MTLSKHRWIRLKKISKGLFSGQEIQPSLWTKVSNGTADITVCIDRLRKIFEFEKQTRTSFESIEA